jgi:phosphoglycerol transferase MdoB-like AlkP superfamily enzyme
MDSMGYESKFLYGGYGYFDNMNYFYSKNGFAIIDRKDMSKAETTFSNAWGVCDEDLFDKVISEGDKSAKAGKPFFYVVMTTSNHRPYTFPAGKIDIKTGTREGAVKYSDYAIGRLIAGAGKKPWAKDTVFVIIADHCAGSARRVALPVKKYEIPMLVYSPGHIKPAVFDRMISQIDVAPTVLDLLGMSYKTRFMGYDIFKTKPGDERAFISTYQKMGFIKGDRLVILDPGKKLENYTFRRDDGSVKQVADDGRTADEALAWYQGRNYFYKHGQDRF